jgi:hypothetical protein
VRKLTPGVPVGQAALAADNGKTKGPEMSTSRVDVVPPPVEYGPGSGTAGGRLMLSGDPGTGETYAALMSRHRMNDT